MPKRIFVVEDNLAFRKSLTRKLKTMRGIDVCGEAGDAQQALASLPGAAADLVLVDMKLPGTMNGFDLLIEIQKRLPNTACFMLSGHCVQGYVAHCRALGFKGYLEKSNIDALEGAILAVLAGESYFPDYDDSQ